MTSIPPEAYGGTGSSEIRTTHAPRCWRCGTRLAEYLSEPYSIRCRRCKAQNRAGGNIVAVTT